MSNLCPCCQKPMRQYTQTALMAGRPDYQLAECRDPECQLFMITLRSGEHELLTAEQIASYIRARHQTEAAL